MEMLDAPLARQRSSAASPMWASAMKFHRGVRESYALALSPFPADPHCTWRPSGLSSLPKPTSPRTRQHKDPYASGREAYAIEGEKQWTGKALDVDVRLVVARNDEDEAGVFLVEKAAAMTPGAPSRRVRVRRGRIRTSMCRSCLGYGPSRSQPGRAGRQVSLDYGG
jgi:hypothetical protein